MKAVKPLNILPAWLAVSGMAPQQAVCEGKKMLRRVFYSAGEPALALAWQMQRAD